MRCPFLKDSSARFCGLSPFRKMIFRTPAPEDGEKCSSPEYLRCPSLQGRESAQAGEERCPHLQEAPVQFCEAAPVQKFIPSSGSPLSPCQGDGHRYCDLYLARALPERKGRAGFGTGASGGPAGGVDPGDPVWVDGVEVRRRLAYAPNHLWLDLRDDGFFHLGTDGFLARVLGRAEKVSFVASLDVCRPVAVLRVRGVDLHLEFPNPLQVSAFNVSLRTEPYRLVSDPYRRGWLFSGRIPAGASGGSRSVALAGLVEGDGAVSWMREETARMTRFVQERCYPRGDGGQPLLSDGGTFQGQVAQLLENDDLLQLFNEFFSLRLERRTV